MTRSIKVPPKELLEELLEKHNGNVSACHRELKDLGYPMSRNTLGDIIEEDMDLDAARQTYRTKDARKAYEMLLECIEDKEFAAIKLMLETKGHLIDFVPGEAVRQHQAELQERSARAQAEHYLQFQQLMQTHGKRFPHHEAYDKFEGP